MTYHFPPPETLPHIAVDANFLDVALHGVGVVYSITVSKKHGRLIHNSGARLTRFCFAQAYV